MADSNSGIGRAVLGNAKRQAGYGLCKISSADDRSAGADPNLVLFRTEAHKQPLGAMGILFVLSAAPAGAVLDQTPIK